MTIDIISGSTVPGLAANIARQLGVKAHYPSIVKFPDGEIRVIEGDYTPQDTVAYVQTMHPRPNDTLVEMLFTVDLLKDLGTRRVIAVIPYLGYTRQDTRHEKGEAISVKSMLKALDFTGVDDILSVDLHLHRLSLQELSGLSRIKMHEVSAIDLLARKAGTSQVKPLVVGPDGGGRAARPARAGRAGMADQPRWRGIEPREHAQERQGMVERTAAVARYGLSKLGHGSRPRPHPVK